MVLHPFWVMDAFESLCQNHLSRNLTFAVIHTKLCFPFQGLKAPGWNGAETWAPAPLLTSPCWLVLVQGLKDLVWLPIEQYRKDGRIVRGFQRGAASFGTSTAMAALELTNRMVQTIQVPLHRLPEGRAVTEPFLHFVLWWYCENVEKSYFIRSIMLFFLLDIHCQVILYNQSLIR